MRCVSPRVSLPFNTGVGVEVILCQFDIHRILRELGSTRALENISLLSFAARRACDFAKLPRHLYGMYFEQRSTNVTQTR